MKKVLLLLVILVAVLGITACNPFHTHTGNGEYTVVKEPTCISEGQAQMLCAECGMVAITVPVPKIEHTEEIISAVESTCTETGLTEGKYCSFCDEVLAPQQKVPLKPHTEVIIPAVEQTCTETGLTAGKYCSDCYTITVKPSIINKHHFVDF